MRWNTLTLLAVLTLACTATPTSVTENATVSFAETPTEGAGDDMTVAASMATPIDSVKITRAEWVTENGWIAFRAVWRYYPDSRGTTTEVFRGDDQVHGFTVKRKRGRFSIIGLSRCIPGGVTEAYGKWTGIYNQVRDRTLKVMVQHSGGTITATKTTQNNTAAGCPETFDPNKHWTMERREERRHPVTNQWQEVDWNLATHQSMRLVIDKAEMGAGSWRVRPGGGTTAASESTVLSEGTCRTTEHVFLKRARMDEKLAGTVSFLLFTDDGCNTRMTMETTTGEVNIPVQFGSYGQGGKTGPG